MKTLLVILAAVVLGVATGVGGGVLRIAVVPWNGDPVSRVQDPRMPESTSEGQPAPKAVFEQTEYDFGSMDMEAEGYHDFVVINRGDGPLKLTAGETSCRCTLSEIKDEELAPGESTKVRVTWTPKKVIGPYRQTATVFTNDANHDRVELVVVGRVTLAILAEPKELVFTRITAGEPATGEVRLLSFLSDSLKIVDCKLADQATADYFEVTFEEMPSEELVSETVDSDPSNDEDVGGQGSPGKKAKALSGCLIRVTVKPGLPQGPFKQKIFVATNLDEAPSLAIPVEGTIAGDISIFGRGYDEHLATLTMGTVSSRKGSQRDLTLLVRGPHREEVEFTCQQCMPEFLEVEVGETTLVGRGAVAKTPLIVRIPPGAPAANHLGSDQGALGEIVLETSHPEIPILRIHVSFAVTSE